MNREVNIPLLRKAVEWAEAEHARSDGKGAWRQCTVAEDSEETHCGTAYCIAGYVLAQQGYSVAQIQAMGDSDEDLDLAAELLGIPAWSTTFAPHLFDGFNDITRVRSIAEELAGERL